MDIIEIVSNWIENEWDRDDYTCKDVAIDSGVTLEEFNNCWNNYDFRCRMAKMGVYRGIKTMDIKRTQWTKNEYIYIIE